MPSACRAEGEKPLQKWSADIFIAFSASFRPLKSRATFGDFRLVDRKVVDCFRTNAERDRFRARHVRLARLQARPSCASPAPRPAAGESKYPFVKMMRLAANGVISFSDAPLRARALGRHGGLRSGDALWLLGHRHLGSQAESGARLGARRSSSGLCGANMMMTGHYGSLCRTHLFRGEKAARST